MASIEFDAVTKAYPGGVRAVSDLSLEIGDGEFIVFVGPSGCGKTTALRMVAGLETITGGELRIGGQRVNEADVGRRDVAMVFQNYALYPHLSVFENIAFPLRARRIPKAEVRERVHKTAALLDLTDQLERRPRALSGGQRQRVAMGRAIIRQPQVFLMDEPLSNLDAKLRGYMRSEIARIQRELGVTTIYVTHDQVEAMTMGDRIAVMRGGILQQLGTARELYDDPTNLFVATFLGSPPMNLISAAPDTDADHRVAIGIRPEHLHFAAGQDGDMVLPGVVQMVEMLGADQLVHLEVPGQPVRTADVADVPADAARDVVTIVARVDRRATPHTGERLDVAVNRERIYLFDIDSGTRIARTPTSPAGQVEPAPSVA